MVEKAKISGEISEKVPSSSLPTGLTSQNSGLVEIPLSKSTDDATELQYTFSHASNGKYMSHNPDLTDIEDDKPSDIKGELLDGSTKLLNSILTTELASDVACDDHPAPDLNPIEKSNDMEVEIQPIDETDDSDTVEHDVKVCDICGDAGGRNCLLSVVGAVMGQNTLIACERCLIKSLKVTGCVKSASPWSG
ncbi:hypothetical protein Pfo_028015 [Paulownia fortunei]|nr:hypothetical protein Pfo_028015 [Paulownia fortunei]